MGILGFVLAHIQVCVLSDACASISGILDQISNSLAPNFKCAWVFLARTLELAAPPSPSKRYRHEL